MTRIIVVSTSPLLAAGVAAALRGSDGPDAGRHGGDDWQVQAGRADEPADLWLLLGDELQLRAANGATGQLSADADAPRLRAAVAAVLEGLSVREAPWQHGSAGPHEPLTPRELEVFELLGKGLSNRDIAGVLGISAHTAKFHVGQILAKVGAATRAEAVSEGLRCGLIGL